MMYKIKGFTLIELLVVIAIIGLLATLAVVAFGNARERARDAKRLSDINAMKKAIELYYQANGEYPDACNPSVGCPATDLDPLLSAYLPIIPVDPTNTGVFEYYYARHPSDGDRYALRVSLEDGTRCKTGTNPNPAWWGPTHPVICDF
ncbi:prepilin-type N-terminal cleavage/methylation domain-containing protein [Candidatus Uhrbacteria bacterium]|nr:prepilin-type N-terminal cleavage/methylation domain-containing protein [Candidatus Uhrbacteria bacterium]MBD3284331.1 prepilin-type N-terminal cleavage/methylation domain-containing protein [Candidatus Uhrbacteria bacterium]